MELIETMNTHNIVALREILIRVESAQKALGEAADIAHRTDYGEFAHDAGQRATAAEHLRARVARRLLELEQLEVEHGLSKAPLQVR